MLSVSRMVKLAGTKMSGTFKNMMKTIAPLVFLICVAGLAFGQTPAISAGGTVNAADYSRSFAPGGIISIFGTNLCASAQAAPQLPLTTVLAGTSVELTSTGQQIPLLFVSAGQINAQLPYTVAVGSLQIRVRTAAGVSASDTIAVSARAPKIFTVDFSGQNAGVITTASNAVLTSLNPSVPSQTVSIWMNSLGATTGTAVAGQASPSGTLSATRLRPPWAELQ